MDPSDRYADPFGEALSYSSQRAAQLVSLAVAAAQVGARRKALSQARKAARDEQARRALLEQERALHEQMRAGWAPAHDPRWLARADLLQAARAWSAAAAYADAEPVAASALRKTEERLRTIHPYAMTRYDRLRAEGASPLDAMRETAPLFTREPHVRPGQPGTRLRLELALVDLDADPVAGVTDDSQRQPAPDQDPEREAEHRGQQIVWRLQARARAERGSELDPAELATVLEATTSLPAEVIARLARARSEIARLARARSEIARLARARSEEAAAASAERARAADLDHAAGTAADTPGGERTEDLRAARRESRIADAAGAHGSGDRRAAELAAESFPCTAADGIRAAANGSLQRPARSPVRAAANVRRPGMPA
jgi:hypothetical protein